MKDVHKQYVNLVCFLFFCDNYLHTSDIETPSWFVCIGRCIHSIYVASRAHEFAVAGSRTAVCRMHTSAVARIRVFVAAKLEFLKMLS